MNWLLRGLGGACVGLGLLGIVLPLVPTTPFLLLAAWAFAHSSPRLHHWLVSHPRFGPPIADWREHGAIGAGGKRAALLVLGLTLAGSWALAAPGWVVAVQAVCLVAVGAFILTRPTAPRSGAE